MADFKNINVCLTNEQYQMHCLFVRGGLVISQSVVFMIRIVSMKLKKTAEVEDSSCQTSLPVPSASAGPFLQQ